MVKFARPNSYTGKQSNKNWTGQVRAANSVEAAAGDSEILYISPSTLASAVGDLVPSATTSTEGVVELSTLLELQGGTAPAGAVPTSNDVATVIAGVVVGAVPAASTLVQGIVELATDAQVVTPFATDVPNTAIQPSNITAMFASPPAIGGTSAGAGSFSTLAASGLASLSASATIETGATALNLASDASTGAVNLGTGAGARTITIGNVTGATAVAINTGTGHFTVTTTGAGDIILNSDDTMLLDSDGVLELNSSGAAINIGNDADAFAINVGTGAAARTITIGNGTGATSLVLDAGTGAMNIGTNAVAHSITIGNVTGATAVAINVGTGNFALEGDVATTYAISNTGANTGAVDIAGGTGARTVTIAGSTGGKTVNIAAGAGANVVAIGSVTGAASMALKVGTGNFTLEGNVASTYAISSTGVNTGQVDIAGGTGARTVNIAGGGTGAKTINIGAGASADIITIGTSDGAGSLSLAAGTGNFALEGATATTYAISNTGANTGQVDIAGGTGARTVNIAGSTGGKTVNIAAGAGANIVSIGSVTGASSLALKAGTGNFTLEGNVATTYDISATGINTGTVRIGSGTGARTVEIAGGGTGIKTINIGRGATADVISIGTTDGAGSLSLNAGTGNVDINGTVNDIAAKYVVPTGIDITLRQSPLLQSNATTGAAPTGATGDVNLMYLQEGVIMEQFILGAGQTIIAPRMTSTGLNIALDQVDNEGAEYNFGAARANSKHAFTIGTSAAFRMDVTLTVADVSGCEPLLIGFRKSEANNATITSYTDYACIGLDNVAVVGNVVISTELNAGGTTNTNTTDAWADTASHKLSVLVSAAGVVTYLIDDVAPSATAAFTFDNADVVCPFIHFLNGADVAGNVELQALKVGFQ